MAFVVPRSCRPLHVSRQLETNKKSVSAASTRRQSTILASTNGAVPENYQQLLHDALRDKGRNKKFLTILDEPTYHYFDCYDYDTSDMYMFSKQLTCSNSGILRLEDWDYKTDDVGLYQCTTQLLSLCGQHEERYIGWGDEGDGTWQPFVLPWESQSTPLTSTELLTALGAHPALLDFVLERDDIVQCDDDDDDDYDETSRQAIADFVKSHDEHCVFHAGSDLLNPVPCFAVAKVQPTLIAGFLGGITHT